MEQTRRDVLRGAGALTVGGVAGCLDSIARDDDGWAVASFFTLADFTREIVGENRSVENVVPSGQHGHEWEPSTSILPSIVESEAFVYLGAEGFQPWVDDAVDEIESNHADDVVLIDASDGIELLEYDGQGHHDHDDGRGHGDQHENHDHDHHDDHDHSHGEYDAKFYSDPLLAKRGVENVRDALVELDPDTADAYEDNAGDYLERLEDLHAEFERRLADRSHDTVVLAGHDSFQYLAERYEFEIYTPYGLSPDDSPSGTELAEVVDFVEQRGIEHVLWDHFDGDEDAELIAEEAETVVDTEMVSPAESVVEEWTEAGHGDYVGQMREITLPAFEKALGAT